MAKRTTKTVSPVIDVDKHDNVTLDGRKVGRVDYIDEQFVVFLNSGVNFADFDLDVSLEKAKTHLTGGES